MKFVIFLAFIAAQQLVLQRAGLDPFSLLEDIRSAQSKNNVDYFPKVSYPPLKWQRQKGIYDSFVHLNFRNPLLRNGYKFPDANAFVTMFVVESLLESQLLMPSLNITDQELLSGVEAILKHKDQNQPQESLFSFWQQVEENNHFRSVAPNIEIPLSDLEQGLGLVEKFLTKTHLKKYAETVGKIISIEKLFVTIFRIPSDSDDTGVAMALAANIMRASDKFPKTSQLVKGFGNSINSYVKYAYDPFADYPKNAIDPRTYVWIRKFIQEQKDLGTNQLQIITTWMQSVDEIQEQFYYRRSPFNVNNVDLSVVANGLYGLTQHTLYLGGKLNVAFFLDNVKLIVWALKNRIVEKYRTNALLYYPPKMAFYWFVARVYKSLATFKGKLPVDEFHQAKNDLREALRKYAVPEVTRSQTCKDRHCFWDDFLGNGDQRHGKLRPKYEDRVFTTSMAVNMLMDTYTGQRLPGKLAYYVKSGLQFLRTDAAKYARENAFFSSSVKNGNAMPNYMPHNSVKFLNGTEVDCTQYKTPIEFGITDSTFLVASVAGIIPDEEYQDKVKNQVCFGQSVPADYESQDLNNATFPYWSSEALTNSMALLALAKGQNL